MRMPLITPDAVLDYLNRNPEFIRIHRAAILAAVRAAEHTDAVVNFQDRLLQKLQHDNRELRDSHQELVQQTRQVGTAQQRIHSAVLALLGSMGLEDLLYVIASDLVLHLGVVATSLCLDTHAGFHAGSIQPGIQFLNPLGVSSKMQNRQLRFIDEDAGDIEIFGAATPMVRQAVLIQLHLGDDMPDALLAIGHNAPQPLREQFDSESLVFLGQVLELQIARWLLADAEQQENWG